MSSTNAGYVPYHHQAREWDARFNVPTDEDLTMLLCSIRTENTLGKFKYVMVSGVEVGTKPFQNDYLLRHVHCCMVYNNRVSKSSILKNLSIKEGNGFYLVPRNQNLPYSGWVNHHKKKESKLDENVLCLFEEGNLPADKTNVSDMNVKRSETEKKRKLDEIIIEMKTMLENDQEDEAFKKFPRNYLTYGEKLKSIIIQRRNFFKSKGDPHMWLFGLPATGKTAVMQVIYPDYYNKSLDSRFFDRFNPTAHSHVLCQDVDHNVMEKLGVQFFKATCDEAGYPIDQKYKTPQIVQLTMLVTSNFTIDDVLPEDLKGRRENLAALRRRFFEVNVRDLLPVLGIKLLSRYELAQLKKSGNQDPRALFMGWDYLRNMPTGEPLKPAEEYQKMIRDKFYE